MTKEEKGWSKRIFQSESKAETKSQTRKGWRKTFTRNPCCRCCRCSGKEAVGMVWRRFLKIMEAVRLRQQNEFLLESLELVESMNVARPCMYNKNRGTICNILAISEGTRNHRLSITSPLHCTFMFSSFFV